MSFGQAAENEPVNLVSISMRTGGESRENEAIVAAIKDLWRRLDEVSSAPHEADLRVVLMFDIPGPRLPVDYEGVRTGSFFRSKDALEVQAAVPDELTAADMPGYLSAVLSEMVDAAKAYAKRRKLPLSTEALERAVGELIARLQA
jgi:hypothetical protein